MLVLLLLEGHLRKGPLADGLAQRPALSSYRPRQWHCPAASLYLPHSKPPSLLRRNFVEINSICFYLRIYSCTHGLPMTDPCTINLAAAQPVDFSPRLQPHPAPPGTINRSPLHVPSQQPLLSPAVQRWRSAFEFIRLTHLRPPLLGGLPSPHAGVSSALPPLQLQPQPLPRLSASAKRRARRARGARSRSPPPREALVTVLSRPSPDGSAPSLQRAAAVAASSGSNDRLVDSACTHQPDNAAAVVTPTCVSQPSSPPPPFPPPDDPAASQALPAPAAISADVPLPSVQQQPPLLTSPLGMSDPIAPNWRSRGNRPPPPPQLPFNRPGQCPYRLIPCRRAGCHCPRDGSMRPAVTVPPAPLEATDVPYIHEYVSARGGAYAPTEVPLWRLQEGDHWPVDGATCVQLLARRLAHKEAFVRRDLFDHELESYFLDVLMELLPAPLIRDQTYWLPAATAPEGALQTTRETLPDSGEATRAAAVPAETEEADAAAYDNDAREVLGSEGDFDDDMMADYDLPSDDDVFTFSGLRGGSS